MVRLEVTMASSKDRLPGPCLRRFEWSCTRHLPVVHRGVGGRVPQPSPEGWNCFLIEVSLIGGVDCPIGSTLGAEREYLMDGPESFCRLVPDCTWATLEILISSRSSDRPAPRVPTTLTGCPWKGTLRLVESQYPSILFADAPWGIPCSKDDALSHCPSAADSFCC